MTEVIPCYVWIVARILTKHCNQSHALLRVDRGKNLDETLQPESCPVTCGSWQESGDIPNIRAASPHARAVAAPAVGAGPGDGFPPPVPNRDTCIFSAPLN